MMKLSRTERWIISNQYRILEALYPDDAKQYAEARQAIEEGYELHYAWLTEYIYGGNSIMTSKECGEVTNILDMFDSLRRTYELLPDKSDIDESAVRFKGFDGNTESKQWAYARYYLKSGGGRFDQLDRGDNFNSHMPTLDSYRRMLEVWKGCRDRHRISKDDVIRITSAGVGASDLS